MDRSRGFVNIALYSSYLLLHRINCSFCDSSYQSRPAICLLYLNDVNVKKVVEILVHISRSKIIVRVKWLKFENAVNESDLFGCQQSTNFETPATVHFMFNVHSTE